MADEFIVPQSKKVSRYALRACFSTAFFSALAIGHEMRASIPNEKDFYAWLGVGAASAILGAVSFHYARSKPRAKVFIGDRGLRFPSKIVGWEAISHIQVTKFNVRGKQFFVVEFRLRSDDSIIFALNDILYTVEFLREVIRFVCGLRVANSVIKASGGLQYLISQLDD